MKKLPVCLFLLTVLSVNTAFAEEFSAEKREHHYQNTLSMTGIVTDKAESLIGQKACFETRLQTSASVECVKITRIMFPGLSDEPELFLISDKEVAHFKNKKWRIEVGDKSAPAQFLSIQK